eukprot:482957_1
MKEAPTTLSDATSTCTDITRMKCDIDSHTNSAIKPLRFGSNTNTSPESSSSSFSQGSPPYCFPASDGLRIAILEPLKIGLESDDEDDDSSLDSSCNDDDIDVPHPCIQPNINNCMEQRSRGSSLVNNFEYFHKESQGSTSAEEHVVSSIISTSTSCTSSLPPASSSTSCTSDTSSTLSSTTATNSTTSNANANADQPIPIPMHDNSTHSLPSLVGSDSLPNKRPRLNRYNNNRPTPRKKKGVTIHKSVAVVPIPSRLEYSSRMRERLWTASSDLASNAARNTIEFASEGWNWRNVIEDENMLVHQANGELIHPIHIHNALYCASQASSGEDINLNLSLLASIVPNSNSNSSASRPLLRSNEPAAKPVQLDATQKSANDSNANPSHAVA